MLFKSLIKGIYEKVCWQDIELQKIELRDLKDEISRVLADNERLRVRKKIEEPTSLGTIQLKDIYPILLNICPNVYISDEYFNLASQEEASKFSEETHVRYMEYITSGRDCENFSWALLGYWSQGLQSFAFGFCWTAKHAFNIMLDNNRELWVCEPQTNKWTKMEELKNNPMYYPPKLIVM
jgi:hypothetical protein